MNPKGLRDHLREHYERQQMSAARVERLARQASTATPRSPRSLRIAAGAIALAACVVAAVLVFRPDAAPPRADQLPVARGPVPSQSAPAVGTPVAPPQTALVVAHYCSEQCPTCRELWPQFAALESKFERRGVRFVMVQLGGASPKLAGEAGIEGECAAWVQRECSEAGPFKVLDCTSQRELASASTRAQWDDLERALAATAPAPTP